MEVIQFSVPSHLMVVAVGEMDRVQIVSVLLGGQVEVVVYALTIIHRMLVVLERQIRDMQVVLEKANQEFQPMEEEVVELEVLELTTIPFQ
jgi:ureidoglycolate hydrolase